MAAPLPIQLPTKGLGRSAEDRPSVWVSATHVGNPDGTAGLWLWPGLALVVASM